MAQLKQIVRKSPHNNFNQEKFQTFLIRHDLLPHTISNDAQIIQFDSSNNATASAPIYELGKQLLNAAKNGNINEIKSLMGRGAAFTPDWLGACPLHYAASNGHVQACEVLLRAGISRNSRTKVDRTPLHMAVYEGHVDVVQSLIKHGADVNARDMLLMTPLQWAVQRCRKGAGNNDENGNVDIALVKCLLTHGAKVTTENKFGNTALDIAKQLENIALVELIQKAVINQQADEADEALVHEQIVDQNGEESYDQGRVCQKETNQYLNDVQLSTTYRMTDGAEKGAVNDEQDQQQQHEVTIEDYIGDDEDHQLNIEQTQDNDVNDIVPILIDNGYCSSTSVDQQQQFTVDQKVLKSTATQNNSINVVHRVVAVDSEDQQVVDPYRLLRQRFGIELLPETEDDGRILKHAMDSGHSVSLTEAGKKALKAFKLQEDQHGNVEQVQQVDLCENQQISTTKQLKKPIPVLQFADNSNNSTKVPSPTPSKVQRQQDGSITVNQLQSNITNTAKRKRLFTNASNLYIKRAPQIVLLQNSNINSTRGKISEESFKVGNCNTGQLHKLVNSSAGKTPAVTIAADTSGQSQIVVHQNKQIRQNSQQESTLFTLTADEFAGLQANGGLITTNNGIYRLMDYNHAPVPNVAPVNVVKQKRSRGDNNNIIVTDNNILMQAEINRQQCQQESETVRVLRQQLQEQRHLVDVYKRKYLKKEAEAERFKQQLKLMLKHRSSNKNLNDDVIFNNETNCR